MWRQAEGRWAYACEERCPGVAIPLFTWASAFAFAFRHSSVASRPVRAVEAG